MLKKIVRYLRSGSLRELLQQTRWIYQYVRQYRASVIGYILLGLTTTMLSLGTSLSTKYLMDIIEGHLRGTGKGAGALGLVIALCVFLALSNILMTAWSNRFSARVNLKVGNEIRSDVYQKILQTDLESVQAYHSGDLLNRINSDVTAVADSILGWVPTLVIRLVQFVAALAIILIYDPTMAVLALLSAPVLALSSRLLMSKMRNFNRKMREVNSEMMVLHEESLQNIQSIKALNLTDRFYQRILNVQKRYFDTGMEYNRFSVRTTMLLSIIGMLVSYLCLGWAVFRLWSDAISFGTMVLFLQLATYLSSSFSALIALVPSAIGATVSAQRIMTILELPKERLPYREQAEQLRKAEMPLAIHVKNLTFAYQDGAAIWDNLNLSVAPGSMIAVIGASGSGKTTLFRIFLGLLNPREGTAQIGCADTFLPLSPSTRGLFSYVPQDSVVFSGTIAETLRLVRPDASEEAIWKALRAACADDFVRELPEGLHSKTGERGARLSGGQNQRLAIARALLSDAPILLLDEVTSALDLETEQRVLENITQAYHGRTCIVATHRKSILPLCDCVYRYENKQLVRVEA